MRSPDENLRVLIKKGPESEEMSLKELEENYASKPEWKVIEEGGVFSVPLEEFRMINPVQRDWASGRIHFGKGTKIEDYTIVQTVQNLNAEILDKYNKEKEKAKVAGKSESESEKKASAAAYHMPQFKAVKAWQDVEVEIKLKKALEDLMDYLRIPALIIRSVSLKAISALQDLGLEMPKEDGEIDLIMAFVSGDLLHVDIFEVKRADTYPWQTRSTPPNKQAINSAEKQLTKDVNILMAILAGIPPSQIVFRTLTCFPDTSSSELKDIICEDCMGMDVICKEDLADLSLLQKKTQVPDKPDP